MPSNVDKSFMGRIFLSPEMEDGAGHSVYINFGWNTKGNQKFPAYDERIFGDAIDEAEYNQMVTELKAYLDESGINEGIARCTLLSCILPPLALIPCVWLSYSSFALSRNIEKMVQAKNWKVPVYVELGTPVEAPEDYGRPLDQTGRPLVDAERKPVWPPGGYNIVVRFTDGSNRLQNEWPQENDTPLPKERIDDVAAPSGPPSIQMPIIRSPGGTMTAPSAVLGGANVEAQLQKLSVLMKNGVITEDAFQQAKAKLGVSTEDIVVSG